MGIKQQNDFRCVNSTLQVLQLASMFQRNVDTFSLKHIIHSKTSLSK